MRCFAILKKGYLKVYEKKHCFGKRKFQDMHQATKKLIVLLVKDSAKTSNALRREKQ